MTPDRIDREELARFLALLEPIKPALVPLVPGTKRPAVKWSEHPAGLIHPRCSDPDLTGIALLTGSRSGGLVVIDIDTKGGGFASMERLERELGPFPATLTVRTPSGGVHIYALSAGRFESNASKVAPGIDVRAEGGIVLCPGSLHPNGGRYRIEDMP